jgi:hypothetical protein
MISQDFIGSLPFIIFFLIFCLILGMFLGDSALYWFLLLVLASMLILNSGKLAELFNYFK